MKVNNLMNNSKLIEKQAILILENHLSICEEIYTKFSENDKSPALDGFIEIYKSSVNNFSKSDLIGDIPVQIKGKKTIDKAKPLFSLHINDLDYYKNNGGCLLFVIDIVSRTVFYNDLLPIYINSIINNKVQKQKTYSIPLKLFPQNKNLIYAILLKFYQESKWQRSSNGNARKFSDISNINGTFFGSLTLTQDHDYPIIKNTPIQLYHRDSSGFVSALPLIIAEKITTSYTCRIESKKFKTPIESSIDYILTRDKLNNYFFINDHIKIYPYRQNGSFEFNVNHGSIKKRLFSLKILKYFNSGCDIYIENTLFASTTENLQFLSQITEKFEFFKNILNFGNLLGINIIDYDFSCNDLSMLSYIMNNFENYTEFTSKTIPKIRPTLLEIGNIKLCLFKDLNTHLPHYYNLIDKTITVNENDINKIPAYALINHTMLINSLNISPNKILNDITSIEISSDQEELSLFNSFSCELLLAYLETKNISYLNIANKLCKKILDKNKNHIHMINFLLTKYLTQTLTVEDKKILYSIYDETTQSTIKWGAAILLDAFNDAEKHFDSIPNDEIDNIKYSPLYKIYESKLSKNF